MPQYLLSVRHDETKEQTARLWINEATDLDAALDWAAKASAVCEQAIEVRPTHA